MARHWHDHDHQGLHDHDLVGGRRGPRGRRFFRSGELHLVLLSLLAQRPQHGYDLMAELRVRFGPAYTPSPGAIYPALTALEAEKLVEAREEGDRKVYSVTTLGQKALLEREHMLAEVEARTGARLSSGALEPALTRLLARVRSVASKVDHAQVEQILDETGDHVEALADTREPKETGP
jgi:DNA-binding PadR family transcriptional regulator